MKTILIGLLALFSVSSYANVSLFCNTTDISGENYQVGIKSVLELKCHSIEFDFDSRTGFVSKHEYEVEFVGAGLGLFGVNSADGNTGVTIQCPSVRKKAFGVKTFKNKKGELKKGATRFYGARASAAVLIGAEAAVFINGKLGACGVLGISGPGFGAGVSGAVMKVKETTKY